MNADATVLPFEPKSDSGLASLVMIMRLTGINVSGEQVRHQYGLTQLFSVADIVRVAKAQGLKARDIDTNFARLTMTPLPAIARLRDGRFIIIARADAERVLINDPVQAVSNVLPREEFERQWSGALILITKRASLSDQMREFNISWFIPAIYKYRRIFSEVLIASFFLQLLALVSPIFFQLVIDKVLVHRGMSTLGVLMLGLIVVSSFEVVLGALRTFVFSHTTNRIDVELGARLFNHLLSLPLAYFQSRRVGDSVARVRELENIRSFLTGSALTLVIDLLFTVVFLAVMFFYSALVDLDRDRVFAALRWDKRFRKPDLPQTDR